MKVLVLLVAVCVVGVLGVPQAEGPSGGNSGSSSSRLSTASAVKSAALLSNIYAELGDRAAGLSSCQFPFTHKGKTYNECTTDDDYYGLYWCSTGTDSRGNHGSQWRHCQVSDGLDGDHKGSAMCLHVEDDQVEETSSVCSTTGQLGKAFLYCLATNFHYCKKNGIQKCFVKVVRCTADRCRIHDEIEGSPSDVDTLDGPAQQCLGPDKFMLPYGPHYQGCPCSYYLATQISHWIGPLGIGAQCCQDSECPNPDFKSLHVCGTCKDSAEALDFARSAWNDTAAVAHKPYVFACQGISYKQNGNKCVMEGYAQTWTCTIDNKGVVTSCEEKGLCHIDSNLSTGSIKTDELFCNISLP